MKQLLVIVLLLIALSMVSATQRFGSSTDDTELANIALELRDISKSLRVLTDRPDSSKRK